MGMPHFDSASATCEIHTFREGLLAAIGHDLKIGVTRFTIDVDEATLAIRASFDARSLKVIGALAGGAVSAKDAAEIEDNIQSKVLDSGRFPTITFTSSTVEREGGVLKIRGELDLHDKRRNLSMTSHQVGDRQVVEVTLHQPDFGIKPYRAPLGVIKVKPDLVVRVSIPWPAQA
jgi:polyisoprenoid-binding protein YceI